MIKSSEHDSSSSVVVSNTETVSRPHAAPTDLPPPVSSSVLLLLRWHTLCFLSVTARPPLSVGSTAACMHFLSARCCTAYNDVFTHMLNITALRWISAVSAPDRWHFTFHTALTSHPSSTHSTLYTLQPLSVSRCVNSFVFTHRQGDACCHGNGVGCGLTALMRDVIQKTHRPC